MKLSGFKNNALTMAIGSVIALNAVAQDNENNTSAEEELIVTGVPTGGAASKLETSISVSTISTEDIAKSAPRGTAEVFRNLPGIRAESSAGGGNSNLSVRGIPLSTGGSKFLSLHEDGLPVLLTGDGNFSPSDGWIKTDASLRRVESVRGGTAGTLTPSGPGGIINMITNTGEEEGGLISFTFGLDYDDLRSDFAFGHHINESTRMFLGGHWQDGGNYRNIDYTPVSGGQVKFNLTHEFNQGFVRFYLKHIDKKEVTFFPQPWEVKNHTFSGDGHPGLDGNSETLYSSALLNAPQLDGDGTLRLTDYRNGIHIQSDSFGVEFSYDLGEGWRFDNKFRKSSNTGVFTGLFPYNFFTDADAYYTSLGADPDAVTIFNGPDQGAAANNAGLQSLYGNNTLVALAGFDVDYDDMGNLVNEAKLNKTFEVGEGTVDVTGGYFYMHQAFRQDWHWTNHVTTLTNDAALLNIPGVTLNGAQGFGQAFGWSGNNIRLDFDNVYTAPFAAISFNFDPITIDASVRQETVAGDGFYNGSGAGCSYDYNGNGTIEPQEQNTNCPDPTNTNFANYEASNTAWSVGANYLLNDDISVFARVSDGAAINFDRMIQGGSLEPNGSVFSDETVFDSSEQFEIGTKMFLGDLKLFVTYFNADTKESNTSVTGGGPTVVILREYASQGVEFEFDYSKGMFKLNGSVTLTDAEISKGTSQNPSNAIGSDANGDGVISLDEIGSDFNTTDPAGTTYAISQSVPIDVSGNTPRRQADWIFNITPSVLFSDTAEVGFNFNGTGDSFSEDTNLATQEGFIVTNFFANYDFSENVSVSLNVNNLFDEVGVTESKNDVDAGNAVRYQVDENGNGISMARSINGRTSSLTLSMRF